MKKHSLTIKGHRTSLSLEDWFWNGLCKIAATDRTTIAALVAKVDAERGSEENLSSAVRVFVARRLCGEISSSG